MRARTCGRRAACRPRTVTQNNDACGLQGVFRTPSRIGRNHESAMADLAIMQRALTMKSQHLHASCTFWLLCKRAHDAQAPITQCFILAPPLSWHLLSLIPRFAHSPNTLSRRRCTAKSNLDCRSLRALPLSACFFKTANTRIRCNHQSTRGPGTRRLHAKKN